MFSKVKKIDGRKHAWNPSKIENGLRKALNESGDAYTQDQLDHLVERITEECVEYADKKNTKTLSVEVVQEIVKNMLMKHAFYKAAEAYILFRQERTNVRETKTELTKIIKEITESNIQSSNILRDNANESGATPAGAYGKIASETNKMYNLLNNINRKFAKEHKSGYMHIHDLNQYNLTFNCLFAPLGMLLSRGFDSGTGYIRKTKRIESAAQVAAVIMQLQSNQQYGGIAADNIDFDLAPFVDISFKKNLSVELVRYRVYTEVYPESVLEGDPDDEETPLGKITKEVYDNEVDPSGISMNQPTVFMYAKFSAFPRKCIKLAMQQTDHDTFEAMEGLITNLNSLQSRSGNQVPFSSLNFGLDTSICGRMVSKNLIKAQYAGMGDGLTAIFPILIFKLMKWYTKNEADPNYDLFLKSIKCLARRFYPNFVSVDSTFNRPYVKYDEMVVDSDGTSVYVKVRGQDKGIKLCGDYEMCEYPEYEYEVKPGEFWELTSIKGNSISLRKLKPETTVAAMGCRSRVLGNINGAEQTTSRGNLAFHTLNLPRLAIETHIAVTDYEERKKLFFEKLEGMLIDARDSLLDRFALLCRKTYANYPVTMQEGLYLTSQDTHHEESDTIAEVMKQGTLSIGYVGLAETMTLLTGKTYGIDHDIDEYAYSIIRRIYDFCMETQKATHLNWSCFATPAEATAGRFANIDKNLFKDEKKLADVDVYRIFGKGYYTNSHMLDFSLDTSLENKIATEAPFHAITNAGHIFYYKLNGDLSKNLDAVKAAIDTMYEGNLGYFTVTMDSDTCLKCHFHGVIDNVCPCCGENQESYFVRMRRITGYLIGAPKRSYKSVACDGKLAEIPDRNNI